MKIKDVVSRFEKSLCLDPLKFTLSICDIISLSSKKWNNKLSKELYHGTSRYDAYEKISNIMTEGFKYPKRGINNKGQGIYLSSQSRYQFLWLTDEAPVIICDVLYKKNLVHRYHAEIGTGFEYVVSDPSLIIPKYVVHYKVEGNWRELEEHKNGTFFNEYGSFGCEQCDSIPKRCDCKLYPTFV